MADDNIPNSPATNGSSWERAVLEKLAMSAVNEQRKSRNWGILFKSLGFLYLFILLFAIIGVMRGGSEKAITGKHTAIVELKGVIAPESGASAGRVIEGLQHAFKDKNAQGVILRINSPGGSPVQAGYINDEIHRLRKKYPEKPLYAVVQDICASGGYYVAVAADKIFVDKASLVGSIGVRMDGFGLTGAMEKVGIERRLVTAGENKGFLDMFSPLDPKQKEYAEKMVGEIHQQFIDVVKTGRGVRLKETPEMFSGLVWTGERSVQLGLADALGSADYVAREVIKAEEMVDYTHHDNLADRLARRFGAVGAQSFLQGLGLESVGQGGVGLR
ncbi:MAG: S49 family peptidase [Burkholderiales bacterium]